MGFTTTHCLFELEDRLFGFSREALQPLAQQELHALCDVVLVEELSCVSSGALNDIGKVLDLFAHGVVQRHRMELTGIFRSQKHLEPFHLTFQFNPTKKEKR